MCPRETRSCWECGMWADGLPSLHHTAGERICSVPAPRSVLWGPLAPHEQQMPRHSPSRGRPGLPPDGLTSYYRQHTQGDNCIYINNQILRRGQIDEVPVFPWEKNNANDVFVSADQQRREGTLKCPAGVVSSKPAESHSGRT